MTIKCFLFDVEDGSTYEYINAVVNKVHPKFIAS